MKRIREDLVLLLIYVVIGVVAAGITGWFLYQNKVEYWEAQACSFFREALKKELQKRSGMEIYYSTSRNMSLPSDSIDKEKKPIKVEMESKDGRKSFIFPFEKHINNVERNSHVRVLHTIVMEKVPLKADSLNAVWKNLLTKVGFPGKTVVRTSVADWQEHEEIAYSIDSAYVAKADSLVSCYIGYRCEIGATGYIYCPWWITFTVIDKVLLVAIVLGCSLLIFIEEYIVRLYRRFFVKRETIIIEKEVPVVTVDKRQAYIYQLEENFFFDSDSRTLKKGDFCIELTPLPARLLQGFLDADDYRLSINEIMQLLWSGSVVTSDRVHKSIERLRNYLARICDWTVENGNLSYQLKNPHSIERISR